MRARLERIVEPELTVRQWLSMPRWLRRWLSCPSRYRDGIFTHPCRLIRWHAGLHSCVERQW